MARLLVKTPGESPSLSDLDDISYLITTLADFRKHLQRGPSQEQSHVYPPPPYRSTELSTGALSLVVGILLSETILFDQTRLHRLCKAHRTTGQSVPTVADHPPPFELKGRERNFDQPSPRLIHTLKSVTLLLLACRTPRSFSSAVRSPRWNDASKNLFRKMPTRNSV